MLKGAFGVLLTPFTEDGKVDYNAFEKELDFVSKTEIEGFFACGTTGEFISLSPEQNIEMLAFVAKHLGGKKKLLAGASDPNPATTIRTVVVVVMSWGWCSSRMHKTELLT